MFDEGVVVVPWYLLDAFDDERDKLRVVFAATTERWRQKPNKLRYVLLLYVPRSFGVKLRPNFLEWRDVIFGFGAAVVINYLVALGRVWGRCWEG